MTRTGKIARLPDPLREELNGRLRNGEKGRLLVDWLNSLPEVRALLAGEFGGEPVNENNLSRWKRGGYREWLARQESFAEARRVLAGGAKLDGGTQRGLADHLNFWITARYMIAAHQLGSGGEIEFKVLRALSKDLATLRRGDLRAARLDLERQRWERVSRSPKPNVQHPLSKADPNESRTPNANESRPGA